MARAKSPKKREQDSILRQISVCSQCRGTGKVAKERCKGCGGKGVIEKTGEIKVKIPSGADTGHGIRIEGAGEKGGAQPGDLYVVINVEKHPIFERHGDDIYLQRDITFATAALGSKITVPGLYNDAVLEIPEGTQTASVFRIDGKGLPHVDGRGQGDEYVIVKVTVPTNLSNSEKDILKEFARVGQNPDISTKSHDNNRSNLFSLIKRFFSNRAS
jgi:molecular chaperone DnaJ